MEHGLHGNAYKAGRTAALEDGKPWNYETASTVASEATEKETNGVCSKECIKHQLDNYHHGKVDRRRKLRVSEQKHHEPYVNPRNPKRNSGFV